MPQERVDVPTEREAIERTEWRETPSNAVTELGPLAPTSMHTPPPAAHRFEEVPDAPSAPPPAALRERFIVRFPPGGPTLDGGARRTLERDVIAAAKAAVGQRRTELGRQAQQSPIDVRIERVEVKVTAPPAVQPAGGKVADVGSGLSPLFLSRSISGW